MTPPRRAPPCHPLQSQITILEQPGQDGGNKFKLVGVVVHDAPFSAQLPYLGSGQPDHEDYVKAEIGGKLPGGFT